MLDNKSIENLKIVLDFVERWNKQDKEPEVAQACLELESLICECKNTKVYLRNGRRTSKFKGVRIAERLLDV